MSKRTHRSDAGFSLAVLIFFATAASILLAVAVPSYQTQARREREEELIFRGEEYMRAIQKYQRRFGAYPPSLEALENQNGLRFIRRLYTDPTTENKPFRLIYLNPDGSLTGSTVYAQQLKTPQLGSINTVPLANPNTPGSSANPNPNPARGQTPNSPGNTPANGNRGGVAAPGNISGGQQTFGTSGIIGVASDTEQTSIKVYNGREKYNEWEFIAISGPPGATNNPPAPAPNPAANPPKD